MAVQILTALAGMLVCFAVIATEPVTPTGSPAPLVSSDARVAAGTSLSTYGAMANIVAFAGSVMAVVTAVGLTWKGRFNWEPVDEDVPRAAQKVCGVVIAVIIATIWTRFMRGTLGPDHLAMLAQTLAGGTLAALLVYGVLITMYIYERVVGAGGKKTRTIKIIGGFWLLPRARELMKPGLPIEAPGGVQIERPGTIQTLLKGMGYDHDLVWPRFSRGLAKASFVLGYVALVGCGTCALATASMLIATVTSPAPPFG